MGRKLPTFLQDDEPEQLLRATRRQRDRLILMTALYLGLRVSELVKLEVPHIDFKRGFLFVRQGKGKKDRALPIPRKFAGPLRGWIGGRTKGYVFPAPSGRRLSIRAVQLLIKRVARLAGFTDANAPRRFTPHKLRHAMASRMLERGADIIAVRDVLGHNSVATTQIYTHCSPERLRELMEI